MTNPNATEEEEKIDPTTPHKYGLDNNDLTSIHTKEDGTIAHGEVEKSSTLKKKKTVLDTDSDIEWFSQVNACIWFYLLFDSVWEELSIF